MVELNATTPQRIGLEGRLIGITTITNAIEDVADDLAVADGYLELPKVVRGEEVGSHGVDVVLREGLAVDGPELISEHLCHALLLRLPIEGHRRVHCPRTERVIVRGVNEATRRGIAEAGLGGFDEASLRAREGETLRSPIGECCFFR